jgi:hypothetical protein
MKLMADKGTLIGILGKAVIDPEFRAELLKDRNAIAEQYQLSSGDRDALNKLDGSKLGEAAKHLGKRPDITVEVAVSGHFDAK